MLEEIASIDRIIQVLPLVVTQMARLFVDGIDAALAQTLCDRLTGTRLMRSTSVPSSANFMAADSPARPPPTTSTRCFAMTMMSFVALFARQLPHRRLFILPPL